MTSIRDAIDEGTKIFNEEVEKHIREHTEKIPKSKPKKKKAVISHKDAQGRTRCKRCNHNLELGKCVNYICPSVKSK